MTQFKQLAPDRSRDHRQMTFAETVMARRAYRGFLPDAVPNSILADVFNDAQRSPSNMNTQPWHVHVVSGQSRDMLSASIRDAAVRGERSLDFTFDPDAYEGIYRERRYDHSEIYYGSMGISRHDKEARAAVSSMNYDFFGAPHVALLLFPKMGDCVRIAADVGMYAQTLMLALASRGIGSLAQTTLGYFGDVVRTQLKIDDNMRLLFGISFGYPDEEAPANLRRTGRGSIDESVTFHD